MSFVLSEALARDIANAMEDVQHTHCVIVQNGCATLDKNIENFDSLEPQENDSTAFSATRDIFNSNKNEKSKNYSNSNKSGGGDSGNQCDESDKNGVSDGGTDYYKAFYESGRGDKSNNSDKISKSAKSNKNVLINKNDECYKVPQWSSEDGFSLRENWVKLLYPSKLKHDLQKALHSGRGAFKAFKDTIASYPQAQKLWELHKSKALSKVINEWYDDLREGWGLERLAQREDSDDEEVLDCLLDEDFLFEKNYTITNDEVAKLLTMVDDDDEVTSEWLWYAKNRGADECYKAKDASGECVGFALTSGEVVTALFVRKEYRGIGIGTRLLKFCAPHKTCLCFKKAKIIGDYNDDYEEYEY